LLSQVQTKLEPLQNCQRTQSDVKGWVGLWHHVIWYTMYIYQCFRETCLHLQGREMFYSSLFYPEDGGSRFLQNCKYLQTTQCHIPATAVRTSNLTSSNLVLFSSDARTYDDRMWLASHSLSLILPLHIIFSQFSKIIKFLGENI
jgi:hypothetical protein